MWASIKGGVLDSTSWFIIGVFVGFAGFVLDSLYWCIPLFLSLFGVEAHCDVMRGLLPYHLIVRQCAGVAAAYCHLRASDEADGGLCRMTNRLVAASYMTVAVVASVMWCIKGL